MLNARRPSPKPDAGADAIVPFADLTEDQLIVEIAALIEERDTLERDLREHEKAHREASQAWGAASERHDEHERLMADARTELRRRMLG